ncbi:hypothetical protein BD626DRAFT_406149, partial [Schizophyllum amplum]
ALCLPIFYREYKRGRVHPLQGLNQARTYLISAISFYAALDMYDVVVFALATVGLKGHLLCGWGEKVVNSGPDASVVEFVHHIVDTNCPEWDLSDSSDAIDFASFLMLLRTEHIPDVVRQFEAKRAKFVADWRDEGKRARFRWTMAHQRKTDEYKEVEARLKAENDTLYDRLQAQKDALVVKNKDMRKAQAEKEARKIAAEMQKQTEAREHEEKVARETANRDMRVLKRSMSAQSEGST